MRLREKLAHCADAWDVVQDLAAAGFGIKELIGGLDFWRRDPHTVAVGAEPGSWPEPAALPDCGC